MAINNQQTAARRFVETWKGRGYEKGETQPFWYQLLHDIFGIEVPANFIQFELPVHIKHTKFIDAYIPSTKVLIEQKELKKNLDAAGKQSDGGDKTPYEQADRYASGLKWSQYPRWIVTCNFRTFKIYDKEQPKAEPLVISLDNLEHEYYLLKFLVDDTATTLKKEKEISKEAGELIAKLYNLLRNQYVDPDTPRALHSLNVLCIRLVFCLFAEKSFLFGDNRSIFHDYMVSFKPSQMRRALLDLFDILNTPEDERDPYLSEELARFPYVNGGLFNKNDNLEIPAINETIANLLIKDCCELFEWNELPLTIKDSLSKVFVKHVELPRLLFLHNQKKYDMKRKEKELKNILVEYNALLIECVNKVGWYIQESDSILYAKQEYRGEYGMCYFLRPACGRKTLENQLEKILPRILSAEVQVDNIIKSLNYNFDIRLCALIDKSIFDNLVSVFFHAHLSVDDIVNYIDAWGEKNVQEKPSVLKDKAPTYYALLEDFYARLNNPYRNYTILGESTISCMLKNALEIIVRNQVRKEYQTTA